MPMINYELMSAIDAVGINVHDKVFLAAQQVLVLCSFQQCETPTFRLLKILNCDWEEG